MFLEEMYPSQSESSILKISLYLTIFIFSTVSLDILVLIPFFTFSLLLLDVFLFVLNKGLPVLKSFSEDSFTEFNNLIKNEPLIKTVYIVTDYENGFVAMKKKLDIENVIQLYRDYLDNFRINVARR